MTMQTKLGFGLVLLLLAQLIVIEALTFLSAVGADANYIYAVTAYASGMFDK
jgi:hypothetical protein